MELTLKVTSGKHAGEKLRIPGPTFLIGRGDDCQLRPNSDLVSRHHCLLLIGTDGAIIRDLDSRNGTFINDERIVGDRRLQHGDRLTIGQLSFEIRLKTSGVANVAAKALEPQTAAVPTAAVQTAAVQTAADRNDDTDVMEWFKEQGASATRDTVRIDPAETASIAAEKETLVDRPATTDGPSDGHSSTKSEHAPSSRPAPRPPLHKDSVEAASQTLKKLFKGR